MFPAKWESGSGEKVAEFDGYPDRVEGWYFDCRMSTDSKLLADLRNCVAPLQELSRPNDCELVLLCMLFVIVQLNDEVEGLKAAAGAVATPATPATPPAPETPATPPPANVVPLPATPPAPVRVIDVPGTDGHQIITPETPVTPETPSTPETPATPEQPAQPS